MNSKSGITDFAIDGRIAVDGREIRPYQVNKDSIAYAEALRVIALKEATSLQDYLAYNNATNTVLIGLVDRAVYRLTELERTLSLIDSMNYKLSYSNISLRISKITYAELLEQTRDAQDAVYYLKSLNNMQPNLDALRESMLATETAIGAFL